MKRGRKSKYDNIHNAGGKAFLAHPFEYKFENTIQFIDEIKKRLEGLDNENYMFKL